MLPTHHVTTKGLCHLVTNFELEEGSNTSTLSPGENCPADISGPGAHFSMTTSPMHAALSKVQDVLNLIFYWTRVCHFSGTPFHKLFEDNVWSSAVTQQPQNRWQRFSWEKPKRSKMSHQMSPKLPGESGGKLRVAA